MKKKDGGYRGKEREREEKEVGKEREGGKEGRRQTDRERRRERKKGYDLRATKRERETEDKTKQKSQRKNSPLSHIQPSPPELVTPSSHPVAILVPKLGPLRLSLPSSPSSSSDVLEGSHRGHH